MKRTILIAITLLALLPDVAKGQWTFDIVSVEAYINDHKKQRSLLLARSTLEYSNQLLHEYSREETGKYKEVNIDLDRYTRAFDVIDVMYQSLRTVLNVKDTYSSVSDRIGDYKTMLEAFHEKILKHGNIEPSDALILTINEKAIRDIANEGEHLYKSVSDLVLYATGAAACSTSDLLMVHGDTYRYVSATGNRRFTGNVPNGKLLTVLSDDGAMRGDWIIDGKRGRR